MMAIPISGLKREFPDVFRPPEPSPGPGPSPFPKVKLEELLRFFQQVVEVLGAVLGGGGRQGSPQPQPGPVVIQVPTPTPTAPPTTTTVPPPTVTMTMPGLVLGAQPLARSPLGGLEAWMPYLVLGFFFLVALSMLKR